MLTNCVRRTHGARSHGTADAVYNWPQTISRSPNILSPGGSWNGTLGSGGAAPAANATPVGSGWVRNPMGAFDEPLFMYLERDTVITVGADTADTTAWIASVDFWFEGATINVATQTHSLRTGATGFAVTIPLFASDGDANLYAYINPVNGPQQRIGPMVISRKSSRPLRYLDPVNGNDAWDGTTKAFVSGTTGPWKTLNWSQNHAPDAAIISLGPGTLHEDVQAVLVNTVTHPITVRRQAGTVLGDVVVSRTTRGTPALSWLVYATQIIYEGLVFECSVLPNYIGRVGGVYIFRGCIFTNAVGGGNGPSPYGIPYSEVQQTFFQSTLSGQTQGMYAALCECQFLNPPSGTGVSFIRNTLLQSGWDAIFIGHQNSGMATFNVTSQKTGAQEQRQHTDNLLTIASSSYDGVKTTIQWVVSGSMINLVPVQTDTLQRVRFFTGVMAGGAEPQVYSQDSTAFTTAVYGTITAVAGDTAKVYIKSHSDSGQLGIMPTADAPVTGIFNQRFKAESTGQDLIDQDGFQPLFFQAGVYSGAGTITTVGTALTCSTNHNLVVGDFVYSSSASAFQEHRQVVAIVDATHATLASAFTVDKTAISWRQVKTIQDVTYQLSIFTSPRTPPTNNGQYNNGQSNTIFRQGTWDPGQWQFRWDTANFGVRDVSWVDSIIREMPGSPFSPEVTAGCNNNHFILTPARGSNADLGAVTFDANHRVLSGVTRTMIPKIKWDHRGLPYKLDGTDLVGAMR